MDKILGAYLLMHLLFHRIVGSFLPRAGFDLSRAPLTLAFIENVVFKEQ
jgi:hypothetical protein